MSTGQATRAGAAAGVLDHPGTGYPELGARWLAALSADPRVRAVEVGGSMAAGAADRLSDLDLLVEVSREDQAGFAADLPTIAARVSPAFLVRFKQAGRTTVCSVLTTDLLRLDLIVGDGGPPAEPAGRRPDLDRDVHEFLRVLALYPTVAGRGEWLAAMDGAMLLRAALLRVLLTGAGIPAASTRRLNDRLPPGDRRRLAELPPLAADPGLLPPFVAAVAGYFFDAGPGICERLAVRWPEEFAARVRDAVGPCLATAAAT